MLLLCRMSWGWSCTFGVSGGSAHASWNLNDSSAPAGLQMKLIAYNANGTYLTDMTSWKDIRAGGEVSSFNGIFLGNGATMKLWTQVVGQNNAAPVGNTGTDNGGDQTYPPPPD
jgi:hypothetical protein